VPTEANQFIKKPLSVDALQGRLQTRVFGQSLIEIHQQIDSTNNRARALGLAGAAEGALVLAETQTAGRGRRGRHWHSPPGLNLYFSLLLRPALPPDQTSFVTLAAGVGSAEAVRRLSGLGASIKWPNDVLVGERKIAGILTEMETGPGRPSFVVLGVGLNVNLQAEGLPPELTERAGSLAMAANRTWDRIEVLAVLLEELERAYQDLISGGRDRIIKRYKQFCRTIGREVRIVQGEAAWEGRALTVDDRGALVIRRSTDDRLITVNAGEIMEVRIKQGAGP